MIVCGEFFIDVIYLFILTFNDRFIDCKFNYNRTYLYEEWVSYVEIKCWIEKALLRLVSGFLWIRELDIKNEQS